MELDDLRYFYEVVAEGNFTKASKSLRIAQPAISRRIKRLEEDLGVALLIRHKRRVELTATGNAVLRYTKSIFENVESILGLAEKNDSDVEGPVKIATADSIANFLLPRWLKAFCERYPKALPIISVGPSEPLLKKIQSGEIDLGLFFYIPQIESLDLKKEAVMQVPHRFVVKKESCKDKKTLNLFIGSREVDSANNVAYPTFDKLKKVNSSAKIGISSNNIALHKTFVLMGMGVAILPEFLIKAELASKKVVDVLPKERFRFELKLVTHKNRPSRETAAKFIEIVRSSK